MLALAEASHPLKTEAGRSQESATEALVATALGTQFLASRESADETDLVAGAAPAGHAAGKPHFDAAGLARGHRHGEDRAAYADKTIAVRCKRLVSGSDDALDRCAAVRVRDLGSRNAGRYGSEQHCEQARLSDIKHVTAPLCTR